MLQLRRTQRAISVTDQYFMYQKCPILEDFFPLLFLYNATCGQRALWIQFRLDIVARGRVKRVGAAGNLRGSGRRGRDRSQLEIEQPFRQKLLGHIPAVWEHTNYVQTRTGHGEWVIIGYFCTFFFQNFSRQTVCLSEEREPEGLVHWCKVFVQLSICTMAFHPNANNIFSHFSE